MIQREFEKIGKTGCYFLSIVHLAELYTGKYIDAYDAYKAAIKGKTLRDDCFVLEPAALLRMLTGVAWAVTKEPKEYQATKGEQEILYFERNDTMQTWGHFVVGDGFGLVAYDPYGDSQTVKKGALFSKRIFRRT
jgi:hypothetical protein